MGDKIAVFTTMAKESALEEKIESLKKSLAESEDGRHSIRMQYLNVGTKLERYVRTRHSSAEKLEQYMQKQQSSSTISSGQPRSKKNVLDKQRSDDGVGDSSARENSCRQPRDELRKQRDEPLACNTEEVTNLLALNTSLRQALEHEETARKGHLCAKGKLEDRLESLSESLMHSEKNIQVLKSLVEKHQSAERAFRRKAEGLNTALEERYDQERRFLHATEESKAREHDLVRRVDDATQYSKQQEAELAQYDTMTQELESAVAELGTAKDAEIDKRRKVEDNLDTAHDENAMLQKRISASFMERRRVASRVMTIAHECREDIMKIQNEVLLVNDMMAETCSIISHSLQTRLAQNKNAGHSLLQGPWHELDTSPTCSILPFFTPTDSKFDTSLFGDLGESAFEEPRPAMTETATFFEK